MIIDDASASHGVKTLDTLSVSTLRDHVHRSLRQAILAGRLRTKDRVNERMLAEQLGVSTTPVKEALRQLEADGLVETLPRRGVIIRFDFGWAEEMILARAALESMVSRLAAQRITAIEKERMSDVLSRMRLATENADAKELILMNETFHDAIHDIARGSYLRRLIDRQQFYDAGARLVIHSDPTERALALAEHAEIGEAIIACDPGRAESAMRDHVMRAGDTYLALIFKTDGDKASD